MVSALNGFGLAIGSMDIIGAVFFELMIICMLCRRRRASKKLQPTNVTSESLEIAIVTTYASVIGNHQFVPALFGKGVGPRMLWTYLILLNVWILASTLLVIGILWQKPQLLLFWLTWCLGGLLFDVVFMLWWFWEMISGDTIDALTNILISMLTMGKFAKQVHILMAKFHFLFSY
ncbi:hypothetical protein ACLKA7_016714 [Drosophila subpalustris]